MFVYCFLIFGILIGVIKDGKIFMVNGYGVVDIVIRRLVINEILFEIVLMFKVFGVIFLVK